VPILIAFFASVVSLFVTGSARVGPLPSGLVPAVEWLGVLLLTAMCVAAVLLRRHDRLFAVGAAMFGLDAAATLVVVLADPTPFPPSAQVQALYAVQAAIGVVAQVLFLLGMSRLCARLDVLRIGFRVLAGCVAVTGLIQTLLNLGALLAGASGWVLDAALRMQTSGYSDFLLLVDAASLVLLFSAWFRVARPA
jgi:hypothetical protein